MKLEPQIQPGSFVFVSVSYLPPCVEPVASVREPEGLSLVIEQGQAERLGLPYESVCSMITLTVVSTLEAVGMTAAFSKALADVGISCNVVAGLHHDHLFVPARSAHKAVQALVAIDLPEASIRGGDA